MIKKIILLSTFIINTMYMNAQAPAFGWAKSVGSPSDEIPNSILTDASGNVFVLGNYDATTDFDPGAGTYTMTPSSGNVDAFLLKLDATGNFVWAKSFGNEVSVGHYQSSMRFDPTGNIIVTGAYTGTADFDPGPGTQTLSTSNNSVIGGYVLKLDVNGNFMWVKDFQGQDASSLPIFVDLAFDATGNILILGYYLGTVDLDPSPVSTHTVAPPSVSGHASYLVLKLNSTGDFVWAQSLDSPIDLVVSEISACITTDKQNNTILSGSFIGTVDFDPGVGTSTLTSSTIYQDGTSFILKLNSAGNFVWVKQTDCPGGSSVANKDLICDNANNIYICGGGSNLTDLDPGTAVFSDPGTQPTNQGYVFKLDPAGNFVWGNFITGDASSDCKSLTFSNAGDLVILGGFMGTYDFDGGTGTFIQTSPSSSDQSSFMCSYSTSGAFLWANAFGGTTSGWSYPKKITSGVNGNIYATGFFEASADYDPTSGTNTLNLVSGMDTYILKLMLTNCTPPASPANNTLPANQAVCAGSTTTLSVNTTFGTVNWYASPTSTTVIGTGTVYVTPALTAGTFTYYADVTTCTVSASRAVVTVTVNPLPVLTVSAASATICSGSSTALTANAPTPVTYAWNTGATTASITVSPTVTTTYTVTGTNACGTVTATIVQNVSSCTGINEMANSGDINIYPNPANDFVSIAIPASLTSESTIVEVCDALGKLVMKETLSHDVNTFNISGLEDGIYFFKVITNNQTIKVGKVVKH